MTAAENIRIRLQEEWIKSLVTKELIILLAEIKETAGAMDLPSGTPEDAARDILADVVTRVADKIAEPGDGS